MSTIAAKKLNEALAKAKDIGLVEETFTIENCEITFRNLRPDEYSAVIQACQGLEDVIYLHMYQVEHIARAIVVINGVDLRNTKYVMVEEPDPNIIDKVRSIKMELPAYLIKNVISTWSKEAVYTAYRKFADVLEKAEQRAKEGITFLIPEETNEEKYRRLLLEAKECEGELPDTLVNQILDEHGFMRKSTADEVKAVMERTDQLAREQAQAEVPEKAQAEALKVENLANSEAERQTLAKPPVDPHVTLQKAIEARTKSVSETSEASEVSEQKKNRTAQIEALEAGAGLDIPFAPMPVADVAKEVVELKKQEVDTKAIRIDQPPRAGINPRFKAPPKA
jgi:hypothetical protein